MTANIPTSIQSTAEGFQSAFPFVSVGGDRHADALAVVAAIAGVSLEETFKRAEALGMPKTGPYYHWLDYDLISGLLAGFGWAASEWKEVSTLTHLPALSICLVEYSNDDESGRYVLVHSGAKCSHDGKVVNYAVDPSAVSPQAQVRTDLKVLKPAWYISVSPLKSTKN